jgi:hypothetical protein
MAQVAALLSRTLRHRELGHMARLDEGDGFISANTTTKAELL